jgi:hypothetical protein
MLIGKERGQAFGIYGAILASPPRSGSFSAAFSRTRTSSGWSWRTIFFINVPVALVARSSVRGWCPRRATAWLAARTSWTRRC